MALIQEKGPMGSSKLLASDEAALLALYEALCSVPYLSTPDNRVHFNFVFQKIQEKKPLKIGAGVLPTMTLFLFEEDPYRNRFARTAWENLPVQSLTAEQYEWAVNGQLAEAIESVNLMDAIYPQFQRFWEGFLILQLFLLRLLGQSLLLAKKQCILQTITIMQINRYSNWTKTDQR